MQVSTAQCYSLSRDQVATLLRNKLRPLLPYSLPLYRRCQFYLRSTPAQTSVAATEEEEEAAVVAAATLNTATGGEVCVCIAPTTVTQSSATRPTYTPGEDTTALDLWLSDSEPQHDDATSSTSEWIATHIDLNNTGETQVWLFASWEPSCYLTAKKGANVSQPPQMVTIPSTERPFRMALFRALYAHIRYVHVPHLSATPTEKWQTIHDAGKIVSLPYRRSKVLFGTISASLLAYFQDDVIQDVAQRPEAGPSTNAEDGKKCPKQTPVREDILYLKYLIPVPVPTTTTALLEGTRADPVTTNTPHGFRLDPLTLAQLQLVLDRTIIPRTIETVKSLVSVGLFRDEATDCINDPIAWGLLSKDASIASLHTEPEYRGRGLAECITKELIRLQEQAFRSNTQASQALNSSDADDVPFAHSDVSPTNKGSRRVFEKLGAKVGWEVAWVEIDVGEVAARSE